MSYCILCLGTWVRQGEMWGPRREHRGSAVCPPARGKLFQETRTSRGRNGTFFPRLQCGRVMSALSTDTAAFNVDSRIDDRMLFHLLLFTVLS